MKKSNAIAMFGGLRRLAAAVGVRRQAVEGWPDVLSGRVEDRVCMAAARAITSAALDPEGAEDAQIQPRVVT